jgi:hypothetical protein
VRDEKFMVNTIWRVMDEWERKTTQKNLYQSNEKFSKAFFAFPLAAPSTTFHFCIIKMNFKTFLPTLRIVTAKILSENVFPEADARERKINNKRKNKICVIKL